MALVPSLRHLKESEKSDGQDESLLQPSDWNAEHKFEVKAKKLIGNSDDNLGPAEELSVGTGLKLEGGALTVPALGSDKLVLATTETTTPPEPLFTNARVLTNTASVTWDVTTAKQVKANVAAITTGMLQKANPADIIVYGLGTAPTGNTAVAELLPAGLTGQTLHSGIPGAVGPPVVAAVKPSWAFSGAPHAVLRDKKGNGVQGGGFTLGDWRDRTLNDEQYDTYEFVTLAANKFKLVAGTYVVEWSAPAFSVTQHQSRLWNSTDNLIVESGTAEVSGTTQNRSLGIAKFTIAANKDLVIQHRCDATKATDGFGSAANYNGTSEIYTFVKIWRVA